MPICPVCEKENRDHLCSQCGFDTSTDYVRYPTFGVIPGKVASAAGLAEERRRKQREAEEAERRRQKEAEEAEEQRRQEAERARHQQEEDLNTRINREFAMARAGDPAAKYQIGMYFFEGVGVDRDYAEAVKWFTQAAKRGDPDAMGMLGDCYYQGLGVKQDHRKALHWYDKEDKYRKG